MVHSRWRLGALTLALAGRLLAGCKGKQNPVNPTVQPAGAAATAA